MSIDIELRRVGLRYDDGTEALRDVDLTVPSGTILGLLGRNGSGKTSMMSLVAGRRRPTSGTVLVDGADPWEDADRMAAVALVDSGGDGGAWKVSDAVELTQSLRVDWDAAYATRLLDRFDVPNVKIARLSRGKRAALACTMGLASRAPVTMFDEAHLGMDAPTRDAFYDELLSDYIAHSRTVVLSTHHIDEVAPLFGRVAILDRGVMLVDTDADDLRARGIEVTGAAGAVGRFVATVGLETLSERSLGGTTAVTAHGVLSDDDRARAVRDGLALGPLPLQDLFVHLTRARAGAVAEEAS